MTRTFHHADWLIPAIVTLARVIIAFAVVMAAALGATATADAHEDHSPVPQTWAKADSSYNDEARFRWRLPRTICVQNNTQSWTSAAAATAELDTLDEVRVLHRWKKNGESCAGWAKRIHITAGHYGSDSSRAWVNYPGGFDWAADADGGYAWMIKSSVYVRLNLDYPQPRTWQQNKLTVLHELMHALMQPQGPEWSDDGHTSRCDSVQSGAFECIHSHTGLTAYDRATVARVYADWGTPTLSAK